MKKKIRIGKIVRVFGIKGELKVSLKTDIPETRFAKGEHLLLVNDKETKAVVENFRMHQKHGLLKLHDHDTIEQVSDLINADVMVMIDSDQEDRVAYHDLIDCVVKENNQIIGSVIQVMDMPAHPVLRIKTPAKVIMIPYVDAFILQTDKINKVIHIKSIEGLL